MGVFSRDIIFCFIKLQSTLSWIHLVTIHIGKVKTLTSDQGMVPEETGHRIPMHSWKVICKFDSVYSYSTSSIYGIFQPYHSWIHHAISPTSLMCILDQCPQHHLQLIGNRDNGLWGIFSSTCAKIHAHLKKTKMLTVLPTPTYVTKDLIKERKNKTPQRETVRFGYSIF